MLKRIIPLILIANINLIADYNTGQEIFEDKCSSHHKGHMDLKAKLLNLTSIVESGSKYQTNLTINKFE
ncbi:MAG: hypothetical protein U9Q30_05945 [Campylobacterota bacterium]|nr:hypothetical protein [Campylobacterota bacterium]